MMPADAAGPLTHLEVCLLCLDELVHTIQSHTAVVTNDTTTAIAIRQASKDA